MSVIDIRTEAPTEVTEIIFGDKTDGLSTNQGYILTKDYRQFFGMAIRDSGEFILIDTKERAEALIKSLQKAIDLGWVK